MKHARRAMIAALLLYGIVCIRQPEVYRFLDAVDLPIHETGHLIFAPFGEFLHFLGGSIFQLAMPIAFVVYFWRRQDGFAASVVLFWVAQNFWNITGYVGDARTQALPLVGGGEHDWAYLLGRLGWLRHDQTLSAALRAIGSIVFVVSIWFAWRYSGEVVKATPASPDQPGNRFDAADTDARRRLEADVACHHR